MCYSFYPPSFSECFRLPPTLAKYGTATSGTFPAFSQSCAVLRLYKLSPLYMTCIGQQGSIYLASAPSCLDLCIRGRRNNWRLYTSYNVISDMEVSPDFGMLLSRTNTSCRLRLHTSSENVMPAELRPSCPHLLFLSSVTSI